MFNRKRKPKSRSIASLCRELGANGGGLYRDPENALVVVWDEGRSFLEIGRDTESDDRSMVYFSMSVRTSKVRYFNDHMSWEQAQDLMRNADMPSLVFNTTVYAAERHEYAGPQRSPKELELASLPDNPQKSLDAIKEELGKQGGGIYRDPNDALVVVWDEGFSHLHLLPDRRAIGEPKVYLDIATTEKMASFKQTAIPWSEATEVMRKIEMPEQIIDYVIEAAHSNGYISDQPSS